MKEFNVYLTPIKIIAKTEEEALEKTDEMLNRIDLLITDKEDLKISKTINAWYTEKIQPYKPDPNYIPEEDLQEQGYEKTLSEG